MTHPSPFAPGQVVKRFHVQLERGCHTREAPLTLEVWYRAVGHDRQGQPVRQAPRLVGAVNTWTNKLEGHDSDGAHLKHYHVPAPAPLHAGCYILKVKIAGETTGPSASSKDHRAVQAGPERVGQLEVCTEVLQLRLGSHASRDHRQ